MEKMEKGNMNIKPVSKRHYIMQYAVILPVFSNCFPHLQIKTLSLRTSERRVEVFIMYLIRYQIINFISHVRNNTLLFQVVKDTVKQNETRKLVTATFAGEVEKLHLKHRRCQNIMSEEGMNRYGYNEESSGMIDCSIKL